VATKASLETGPPRWTIGANPVTATWSSFHAIALDLFYGGI